MRASIDIAGQRAIAVRCPPMRLGISLGFVVVCSLGAACKSESTPPVYLDTDYQLRCEDCMPRTSDDPEREIKLLDGENDFTITCTVKRISGKDSMDLRVQHDVEGDRNDYGIRLTRVNVGEDEQSDECHVRVTEGNNQYEGDCTGGDPSTTQPCTVSFSRKDQVISGTVYCDKIPNQANLASFRYLVSPNSDDKGLKLAVHNCEGLD